MQFHTYGKAFTCNFCSGVTQTPPDYLENIGPDGRRRDADERPELSKGSVEFVAPPEFQVWLELFRTTDESVSGPVISFPPPPPPPPDLSCKGHDSIRRLGDRSSIK